LRKSRRVMVVSVWVVATMIRLAVLKS